MVKQPEKKDEIVNAALESLRRNGYAGTSTRAIATIGGFNPALIFYYFGSLNGLLVAALERSSSERLDRYRGAVESAGSAAELTSVLERIYREDVASGHIRVVSELVAASVSVRELAPPVVGLMEPWVELAERAIARVVDGSPLAQIVPPRRLALAAVTFYLGANLLTALLPEDDDVAKLLTAAAEAAPALDALLGR